MSSKQYSANNLIQRSEILYIVGNKNTSVASLTLDSRKVQPGSLFFAVRGEDRDGHNYIESSIKRGAKVIVCSNESIAKQYSSKSVTIFCVKDIRNTIKYATNVFYDNPSSKLKLVGITGTNGKTTIATLLHSLFTELGYMCGLLSTIENCIGKERKEAELTTPDIITINQYLAEMVECGCTYAFMEVSSHAIIQGRIGNLTFTGGVFTNLTHDHLDYHKTFDAYLKAKKLFFDNLPKEAFALTNKDDKNGEVMLQNSPASRYTYSCHGVGDFNCRPLEMHIDGSLLEIDGKELWSTLIGQFNGYNLLSTYATALLLNQDKMQVLSALSALKPVKGRMEVMTLGTGQVVFIDYAHTPDALEKALITLKDLLQEGKCLVTVFGCGGNRDKEKRTKMMDVALLYSHKVVVTSDNPREEDPDEIIEDVCKEVSSDEMMRVIKQSNRTEAIKVAYMLTTSGDTILIAGKGHEQYQVVGTTKVSYSDYEVLNNLSLKN